MTKVAVNVSAFGFRYSFVIESAPLGTSLTGNMGIVQLERL
jgi:hypothetical protein